MIQGVLPADDGWLPVALVVAIATLVALRRRRAETDRPCPPGSQPRELPDREPARYEQEAVASRSRHRARRCGSVLVVLALVGGSVLLGQPAFAQPLSCKESPEPDRPGTGLVGSLDPPTYGVGEPGSVYDEVGYAGLVWHNYDLGCAGTAVFNPATTTDTWLGNQTLNVAKFVVGGVNWSHYLIADGGELLSPLDNLISAGTRAMYDAVFTTWIGPVLLILSVILLWLALRGDLARETQRAGMAVVALVVGSAAYLAPVDWATAADDLLLDGVTQMQEGFLGQVGLGDRDTLPTVLVDQIIYRNWLRGEFGSPDVPQAQQLGRELLRAQTFTKAEIAEQRDTMELAAQKKAAFAGVGERMGDRYPYFQGRSGSRVGAGLLAIVQAACIGLFQLLSKVLVLVAMLVLRLLVMTAPAVAVVAVLKPDVLPALLRVAGAAIVNTLVVGALAGLHALLVVSLFRPGAGVDLWLSLLVTGVVTVVLWAVARPFRRLVSMVSLTREQFGGIVPGAGSGAMSRVWQRLHGAQEDDRQSRWWSERQRAGGGIFEHPDGGRPEAEPGVRIPARATATPVRPRSGWDGEPRAPQARVPLAAAQRPALPAGPDGFGPDPGRPSWSSREGVDPIEIDDRVLYRRPDAVPLRPGGARPVEAELVDGETVYRIYRPGARRPVYTPSGRTG